MRLKKRGRLVPFQYTASRTLRPLLKLWVPKVAKSFFRFVFLWVLGLSISQLGHSAENAYKSSQHDFLSTLIRISNSPAGGDIDAIRRRGYLRVLVVPNKTHYLVDRGKQFGLAYDIVRDFEAELNKGFPRKQKEYLSIVFIPVHRDEIFKRLSENRGDIAVANLTVTKERELFADFSVPYIDNVKEILVSSPGAAPINSTEELSGKLVHVRKSSSYYVHLQGLNAEFASQHIKPIRIIEADEYLEAEDLMEMLNAGLIEYSVIDQHIGELWTKIFPKVQLHRDLTVASGQRVAWAVRKSAPRLLALVDDYLERHNSRTSDGAEVFRRYLRNTKWAKGATSQGELDRFNRTISFFQRYADRYAFDPLMLAAQGYQESGLDQSTKSRAGAIGIMQLLPSTGRSLRVGDIRQEESNIHGGAKYMRELIERYFNDPNIDEFNRTLFAFAAYNAGPQRVQSLRQEATQLNLNPNLWFDHVETVAALRIGRETVQYVANISKYYIAYRLIAAQRRDALMSERE